MKTLLIFPSCTDEANRFYQRNRDTAIVASSSVLNDPTDAAYPVWRYLPGIVSPEFPEAFVALVREFGVDRFFTSLVHVQETVTRLIREKGLAIQVVSTDPLDTAIASAAHIFQEAKLLREFALSLEPGLSLSEDHVAAVLFHFRNVYGESRENKLAAFMACLASAPCGDVIEIGALMGKSSFSLGMLARWFSVGAVLVVDPWDELAAVQEDLPESLVERTLAMDWESVYKGFLMATLPLGSGGFNYLRLPSAEAHAQYVADHLVTSPQFGDQRYQGRIAFIHIDGNHNRDEVRRDCDLWLAQLAPSGWVVLDDYTWMMGDGPRLAGDALLERYQGHLRRAFVCAGALFLQVE